MLTDNEKQAVTALVPLVRQWVGEASIHADSSYGVRSYIMRCTKWHEVVERTLELYSVTRSKRAKVVLVRAIDDAVDYRVRLGLRVPQVVPKSVASGVV